MKPGGNKGEWENGGEGRGGEVGGTLREKIKEKVGKGRVSE